jgi:hypothetical protein
MLVRSRTFEKAQRLPFWPLPGSSTSRSRLLLSRRQWDRPYRNERLARARDQQRLASPLHAQKEFRDVSSELGKGNFFHGDTQYIVARVTGL